MKKAPAVTLSEHLLREADRFVLYPQRAYRTKANLALQKAIDDGLRRHVEWRKTFAPAATASGASVDVLADTQMLDQMYCRSLLGDIPGIVERTQSLRTLTLKGISNLESLVYLREAASCYISGLPQAAVALSRAAVENRLRQVCGKFLTVKGVSEVDFKELID